MSRVTVRFAETAVSDLEALMTWYESHGVPEVGERIVVDIVARIEDLAQHPDRGRIVPEFGQPFLRELILPPFRIVYRRDPTRIRIVRIWRSERVLAFPEEEDT